MSEPDVLILGGGIIGLACALELDRRGWRVEVVERGRPGGGASDAAAGMLAPLAEIGEDGPMMNASRASRDLWPRWAAELTEESGLDIDFDASGALVVDVQGGDRPRRLAQRAAEIGEQARLLGRDELRDLVPDIAPEIEQAALLSGEYRVDNQRVCQALVTCLEQRGVLMHAGCEVDQIEMETSGVHLRGGDFDRRAERLLVAAGAWSGRLPGLPAQPVHPVRGQMFELKNVDWPWMGSVWAEHLYVVRRAGGHLLVGATVEDTGFDNYPTPEGLARLLEFCHAVFPGLDSRPLISTWSGLRPGTADGLPLIGRLPDKPIWIATGHYRNGILLAPWTAQAVADLLTGQTEEDPAFSPNRFTDQ